MLKPLAAALVLVVPAIAHAAPDAVSAEASRPDPRDAYVSVGAQLLLGHYVDTGLAVEGARQLSGSAISVHGLVGGGQATKLDFFGPDVTGTFAQARIGLEAEGCGSDGRVCAFGGIDVGILHEQLTDPAEPMMHGAVETPFVMPRAGAEVGSRTLRLRGTVELSPEHIGGAEVALAYHF